MLDLVIKDIHAGKRLLWLVLPLGVLHLATFASFGPAFLPAALVFTALLAFGSIAVEEIQGTELLWNSLPLTRGQVVAGRYLTVLVGMLTGLGLSWGVARVVTRLGLEPGESAVWFAGLRAHALLFVILALTAALFLPLYFSLGASRGVVVFSAVVVALLIALSLLGQLVLVTNGYPNPVLDPAAWKDITPELQATARAWLQQHLGRILLGLVTLSAAALAASALIAATVYDQRDLT